MSILKKALLFSFISKYLSLIVQFAAVMVISRVLSPSEIGIYSLAATAIAIGLLLRDFGISYYLIQEKELTQEKIRACFTISFTLCATLAGGFYAASSYLAAFYNNENVELLVKILCISFLIIPFGSITLSLLKRDMKFEKLMIIDISSNFINAGVSIVLALKGYSFLSLAIASVAGTLTTALISFFYTKRSYFIFTFSHLKGITKSSSIVSLTNITNQLQNMAPEIAIGKILSAEHVAYFSKAVGTTSLFSRLIISGLTPVLQPYFADLKRNNHSYSETVYFVFNYTAILAWPFCIFVFIKAEDIVLILYGDQWSLTPPILRIIIVGMFINYFTPLVEHLLTSISQFNFVFKLSVAMLLSRIAVLIYSTQYGLIVLAYSLLLLNVIRLVLILPNMMKMFSLNWSNLFALYKANFIISAILTAFLLSCEKVFAEIDILLTRLLIEGVAFVLFWLLLTRIFKHPIYSEVESVLKRALLIKKNT